MTDPPPREGQNPTNASGQPVTNPLFPKPADVIPVPPENQFIQTFSNALNQINPVFKTDCYILAVNGTTQVDLALKTDARVFDDPLQQKLWLITTASLIGKHNTSGQAPVIRNVYYSDASTGSKPFSIYLGAEHIQNIKKSTTGLNVDAFYDLLLKGCHGLEQQAVANSQQLSSNTQKSIKMLVVTGMTMKESKAHDFPYTVKWTPCLLPTTEETKAACKNVVVELKQIQRSLEVGISYIKFCDSLREEALAIERIKDTSPGLPPEFLSHLEDALTFYKIARDSWHTAISASDLPLHKISSEMHRNRCLTLAGQQVLYCRAIAEGDPKYNDQIVRLWAELISVEQTVTIPFQLKNNLGAGEEPHPVLSKMTSEQIEAKFQALASEAETHN